MDATSTTTRARTPAPPAPARKAPVFVLGFADIGRESVSVVGGKGANLGEMTRAGLPVPGGFVVTVDAYRAFIAENDLEGRIRETLAGVDPQSIDSLERASRRISELIEGAPLPAGVERAVRDAYQTLAEGRGTEPFVAVRSSATAEDTARFSFAGMFQSFLNVRGADALASSVKRCWASAFGPRVLFYRAQQQVPGDLPVAAVVQRMVESEKSGVLFTVDPATGDRGTLVIEAAYGLGEVVVLGQVTPDHYRVAKAGPRVVARTIGHKPFQLVRDPRTGESVQLEVPAPLAGAPVLTDDEVLALARLGVRLEEHYGAAQDAEWATQGGRVHLLQTRPITTLAAAPGVREEAGAGATLVRGLPASPGVASGRARVLLDVRQAGALEAGEVLVATTTTPDWVPVMRRAVAIVTDTGGATSHAAIVSRELGIPCVVGTREGTRTIETGTVLTVNGGTGEVMRGDVRRAAQSPLGAPTTAQGVWASAPVTATRLYVNLAEPALAERVAALPVDGVGLLRAEFMMLEALGGKHPRLLLEQRRDDEFVGRMEEGLRTFARAFHPRPVVYRAMDFRSNEFRNLEGGERFEPEEANPMIGYRGCFRYTKEPDLFGLELKALARVRKDFPGLHLMLPFVRTGSELEACLRLIDASELGGDRRLERWVMAEVPSILFWLESYARMGVTGVSIGSNDLTQLMLGVDRDSDTLAPLFDERDPAVLGAVRQIIRECRRLGITSSICGQAPSVHPDYAERLVEWGIDSVSVSPDAVDATRRSLAAAERRILLDAARGEGAERPPSDPS
jgi:pyruvate,water dikinase